MVPVEKMSTPFSSGLSFALGGSGVSELKPT